MKELTVESRWKRVKMIWAGFLCYTLLAMLLTGLSQFMNHGVVFVISMVLYLMLLSGFVIACALRNGNDPAVRSHLSRQIYVFLVFSILYILFMYSFFFYMLNPVGYRGGLPLGLILFVFVVFTFLLATSLFGVIRSRYHAPLGSTTTLVFITLMIVAGAVALGLIIQSFSLRQIIGVIAGFAMLGLIATLCVKKRQELKR
jgi:hypothetical protein